LFEHSGITKIVQVGLPGNFAEVWEIRWRAFLIVFSVWMCSLMEFLTSVLIFVAAVALAVYYWRKLRAR
jgi:Flp pilus assembly protein TadB